MRPIEIAGREFILYPNEEICVEETKTCQGEKPDLGILNRKSFQGF